MSDDENEANATVSGLHFGSSSSVDEVRLLAAAQEAFSGLFLARIRHFLHLAVWGNSFENFVRQNEPNDCLLVAKYAKTTKVDLLELSGSILVDSVTLHTLHIPHPLASFLRNQNNKLTVDVLAELKELPVLVFLHGMGGQMAQFEPLMALLSQCLEIVSLDLPGFGNSRSDFSDAGRSVSVILDADKTAISASIKGLAWRDYTSENIVSVVHAFLSQQIPAHKKVVLVGHLMGTHLAVKLAARLPPNSVEGLVLLLPPPFAGDDAPTPRGGTVLMLQIFTYVPFLFNAFRVWDRVGGLESPLVLRQLTKATNMFAKLRQLRWNMDVDLGTVLRYARGFQRASFGELATAVGRLNAADDLGTYLKTLLVAGDEDHVTPLASIDQMHQFLSDRFGAEVSAKIHVSHTGHSLLLPKPEFVAGMVLNHIEQHYPSRLHLSPAWVLRVKADISGDKWGLKNEQKWLAIQGVSLNICRKGGTERAPLLGMKTLREGDQMHSPRLVEQLFYGEPKSATVEGKLVAVVDISADIPPYSPTSFEHVKYYKCATVLKVVPDLGAVRRFIQLIDDILAAANEESPLVAVHCHYGFNRTGFLICCYLVERLGWTVREAVDGFQAAKPPGIKHPHFVDALYVRYES